MKKLIVLIIIGGLGYMGYRFLWQTPTRACSKMIDLCGENGSNKVKSCEEGLAKLEKFAGEEATQKAVTCINGAKSCAEGVGCVVGAALGGANELLKGIEKSTQ